MSKVNIDSSVLKDIVRFTELSDGVLAKQAAFEDQLAVEGSEIVDSLIAANVLAPSIKEAACAKLKQDPMYVVELLQKAASAIEVEEPSGKSTRVKSASAEMSPDEAFINVLLS
jgi:hypothetical protein